MEKDINTNMGYRKQWVGLNGAPATSYLTLNTALGNKKNELFHAVGFTVINDEVGAINRFVSYATYACHVPLSATMKLSAGLSAGISTINVHESKLELENPVDPAVYNYSGKAKADINAGISIYDQKFTAGISVQQIVPRKIETNGNRINIYGLTVFPGKSCRAVHPGICRHYKNSRHNTGYSNYNARYPMHPFIQLVPAV